MKKFLTIYLLSVLFFILSVNLLLAEESKGNLGGGYSDNLTDEEFNALNLDEEQYDLLEKYGAEGKSLDDLTDEEFNALGLNEEQDDLLSKYQSEGKLSGQTKRISLTYPWSDATDFKGLVSKFYNIALGLVGVAALGAIIYGGILWTVSKTPSGSQEAKDWITGAVWGLLLLLGAYLLFNTIGIIKEGKLVEPGIPPIPAAPAAVAPTPGECPDCTALPSEINCKNNCQVVGEFAEKLTTLNAGLKKADISWQVTEAWPPTSKHQNNCHYIGTCVDANFTESAQPSLINKFIEESARAKLKAVYEVGTSEKKDELIKAGVKSDYIQVVPKITAPHFSIYDTSFKPMIQTPDIN